jgi:hypothetical protein
MHESRPVPAKARAHTRLHLCHEYPPEGRGPLWVTTVAEQRAQNIHVHHGVTEAQFVDMRTARDKTLKPMPTRTTSPAPPT